jgi:hypothetical protein
MWILFDRIEQYPNDTLRIHQTNSAAAAASIGAAGWRDHLEHYL